MQRRDRTGRFLDPSDLSRIVAVDVETTGLSPARNRIVQLGLVGLGRDGAVAWEWDTLLHPGRSIPTAASAIHGIFNADVADAPAFSEQVDAIERRLRGAVLLAHNLPFDLGFLKAEFARQQRRFPAGYGVDTLALARALGRRSSNRLGEVCRRYGVEHLRAHRAIDDALAAAGLLPAMLRAHPGHRPRLKRI